MDRRRVSNDQKRRRPLRQPIPRILIVTEGEKTEVNYFEEIRKECRIPTQNCTVLQSRFGVQPLKVIASAKDEFQRRGKAFDYIFVVFDRDDHPDFENAVDSCNGRSAVFRNDVGVQVRITAIALVPCFEIWLLLHFEDVQATLHRDEVSRRLKLQVPSYEKNIENVFELTRENLHIAKERSSRLRERCERKNGDFLLADVDRVIDQILDVAEKSKK